MSENELIQACIENDPRSQKQLYDTYSRQMYSICLRYCKDAASANDALQEGFINVFKGIKSYKYEGSFVGWIRRIIVNASLNQIKLDRKTLSEEINEKVASNISYEMEFDFHLEGYNHLVRLLDLLPQGYKVIFSMFVIDEMSHAEIAASLNITESTSRSQLFKARKYFQKIIKEQAPQLARTY